MMDDQPLDETLRHIHQDRTRLPDPAELHQRVMAIPATHPQRHHRTSLLPSGRTPSVLSTFRFAAAAAVVALFGGFLLSGILTSPRGEEAAPAVATASSSPTSAPARVVVDVRWSSYSDLGTVVQPGSAYGLIDGATGSMTWDATDSRLSGVATYSGRQYVYPELYGDGLDVAVWTVTNDEGTWRGESRGIDSFDADSNVATVILTGEAAYEGLTAYLTWGRVSEDDCIVRTYEEDTMRGLILAEDWPPLPEPDA
jgi:hypothetical protein